MRLNWWLRATGLSSAVLWRLGCMLIVTSFGGMLLGLFPLEEAQASASIPGSPFTTAGETHFVVPPNVTTLSVVVIGAAGGKGGKACACQNGGPDGAPGGQGALVTADVAVIPGQTIYVEVGSNGGKGADGPTPANCTYPGHESGGAGGTNGGGTGGTGVNCLGGGGGGGGYSALRVCPLSGSGCPANPWLVLAGGGGGGSAAGVGSGGGGGTPNGADGQTPGYGGGRGGTQTAAGAGGEAAGGYTAGSNGSGTRGGTGGDFGGGGGGGGYFGGGGGGWGGGGGGGSSYGPSNATYTTTANASSVTVTYNDDMTAPTSSVLTTPASPDGNNGWYKTNVTVSLSATDNTGGTGVNSISYYSATGSAQPIPLTTVTGSSTSFSISTDGTTTINYYATDNAGNAETAHSLTIKLDKTAPAVGGPTPDRAPDSTGYYNHTVYFGYSCADGDSGIASAGVNPSSYSGPDSNSASVTATCQDVAGNLTSNLLNLKYDATPPTITASATKADGTAYMAGTWTNQNVTVSFSCSDATSGIAPNTCPAPVTLNTEGTTNSVSRNVSDIAGNSSSASFGPIQIDKTAPTVTATPDRDPNTNGWYNHLVTFSFTAVDETGGSGVANCDTPKSYSGPDSATASVTGNCSDIAGNIGSVTPSFQYDATKPVVSYTGNAGAYTVDQQVYITCQATDNLSGIASTTCTDITGPAYNFALGNNTFSASATDKAGNAGSNSTSFTVSATFDSLASLVSRFSTDPAVTQGLNDKLTAAKAAGDTKTKNNILSAFRQQVTAQIGKALTKQQATILINLSKTL